MKYLFCMVIGGFFSFPLTPAAWALAPGQEVREERPAEFVDAAVLEPSLAVDLLYYGADNFVGRPISGYKENRCLLLRSAAESLKKAQARIQRAGKRLGKDYTLLLRDCYRPHKATEDFIAWSEDPADLKQKEKFYPHVEKREILSDGYLSSFSAHSRGATVDVTVAERGPNGTLSPLDMGAILDFFGEVSRSGAKEISAEAKANRRLLFKAMGSDFRNYEKEWWHFTQRPEPHPGRAYNFDVTAIN
ncbi:MAG: peptidase M15 [Proteobacteria bacterium]|nr:MAG: peptidase M15 [Pseudomonadota bacterium]